jgi:hypothetical protein
MKISASSEKVKQDSIYNSIYSNTFNDNKTEVIKRIQMYRLNFIYILIF